MPLEATRTSTPAPSSRSVEERGCASRATRRSGPTSTRATPASRWSSCSPGSPSMLFYELNQVPERNYIKFLQLLGLELRPAQPARGRPDVHAAVQEPSSARCRPARRWPASPPDGGDLLIFETDEGLDLDQRASDRRPGLRRHRLHGRHRGERDARARRSGRSAGRRSSAAPCTSASTRPTAAIPAPPFPRRAPLPRLPARAPPGGPGRSAARPEGPPAPAPVTPGLGVPAHHAEPPRWRALEPVRATRAPPSPARATSWSPGRRRSSRRTVGKVDEPGSLLAALPAGRAAATRAGAAPEIDCHPPEHGPRSNLATVRDELVGESDGRPNQVVQLRRRPVAPAR